MPIITVYLDDRTYWKVTMEAEKMGWKPGKFVSEIVKSYIRYLEEKEGEYAGKEIQTRGRVVFD